MATAIRYAIPFARTAYKLNWIVNARILSVNVLNFIRYSQRLFIYVSASGW